MNAKAGFEARVRVGTTLAVVTLLLSSAPAIAQTVIARAGNATLYRIMNSSGSASFVLENLDRDDSAVCTVTWYNPNASLAGAQIPSSRAVTVRPSSRQTFPSGFQTTFQEVLSCRMDDGERRQADQRRQDDQRRAEAQRQEAERQQEAQRRASEQAQEAQEAQEAQRQRAAIDAERQRHEGAAYQLRLQQQRAEQDRQNALMAQQQAQFAEQQRALARSQQLQKQQRQQQREQAFNQAAAGLMAWAARMDAKADEEAEAAREEERAAEEEARRQRLASAARQERARKANEDAARREAAMRRFSAVRDAMSKTPAVLEVEGLDWGQVDTQIASIRSQLAALDVELAAITAQVPSEGSIEATAARPSVGVPFSDGTGLRHVGQIASGRAHGVGMATGSLANGREIKYVGTFSHGTLTGTGRLEIREANSATTTWLGRFRNGEPFGTARQTRRNADGATWETTGQFGSSQPAPLRVISSAGEQYEGQARWNYTEVIDLHPVHCHDAPPVTVRPCSQVAGSWDEPSPRRAESSC